MNNTIFLGDSLTANFKLLDELQNVKNMGIGGDKTIEVIGRIKPVILEKPDKLFLLIGINDFLVNKGIWTNELKINIFKTYDVLLELLKTNLPKTKFYCLAIFPLNIGSVVKEEEKELYNKEIDDLNSFIKNKVKEYDMEFLDLTSNFKDSQNCLKIEYTLDGIHLNEKGYEVYFSLVKNLLA